MKTQQSDYVTRLIGIIRWHREQRNTSLSYGHLVDSRYHQDKIGELIITIRALTNNDPKIEQVMQEMMS